MFKVTESEVKNFVKERYIKKFNKKSFNKVWNKYKTIPNFKINENWFKNVPEINDCEYINEIHFVLRLAAQFYLTKAFQAMKIDLNDDNVKEDIENGNIGTPGRVAKMWCGADTHDDRELMGGRFMEEIRLAKFPNTNDKDKKIPIIKEVDLMAVCSHHLAPFGTLVGPESKVVIAYIPEDYVLGISKLQRVVRHIAQRGWLQEDLTKAIYDEISKAAQTDNVYVKLKNIEHTCEKYRGAVTQSQGFTTEYYGGEFKDSINTLKMVRNY